MWLKRWTPQNIVIGGAAGAFPPMIGWAVATSGISMESVLMFLVNISMDPTTFSALALFMRGDYEIARVPSAYSYARSAICQKSHIFLYPYWQCLHCLRQLRL